MPDKKNSEK